MKQPNRDHFEFSTGRKFYANCGIIGIDHTGELFTGFDDYLSQVDAPVGAYAECANVEWSEERWAEWEKKWNMSDEALALTQQERHELAEHMIELWTKFRVRF